MKTSIDFKADNDGNIEVVTTVTYTPQEWLLMAGEVYRFASEMSPGYRPSGTKTPQQVKDKKAENDISI